MNKWKLIFILGFMTALISITPAFAHGAKIEYRINMSIEITASYDSGEPMAEAQVIIYAPNDLSNPWKTGTTDSEGRYSFIPDPLIPGTWDIQVRQAGHGDIIHIPVGEAINTSQSAGFSPFQTILMGVCVIWGFIGTALFFSRRKS